MPDNFYPTAILRLVDGRKSYSDNNANLGVVLHSMEGSLAGAFSVLDIPFGDPACVSWHFSIAKDGKIYQHGGLNQSLWHAGNAQANKTFIGIEHEGVKDEPLTALQEASSVSVVRWVAVQGRWAPQRSPRPLQTLWEHRELSSTTCPNGRIDLSRYMEDETVTIITNQIEAFKVVDNVADQAGSAIGQSDRRYVAILDGAPDGFQDVIFRVKVN